MRYIRKSVAILLCNRIQRENAGKWYTPGGLTCKFCLRSSKGDLAKMRMRRKKGYRGCRLVNDWHGKLSGTAGKERILKMNANLRDSGTKKKLKVKKK